MVTPARKRKAVAHLVDAHGMSERRACKAIVRSTQFLEFLGGIADSSADGNIVRLPPVLFQPIAADDVAASVADVALAPPHNGIVEIAGPERAPFNEIVRPLSEGGRRPARGRERSRGPILGRPG
jgi:uncharacterized protein YbjT (DUF2867 family)